MKKILRVITLIILICFITSGLLSVSGQTIDNKGINLNSLVYKSSTIKGNRIITGGITNNLVNDNGNYFYLDHNLNGYYDGIGVPFIDFRTNFDSKKMIIYAHSNMSGTGPFQVLQNYHNNYDYYINNPYIEIYYNNKYYKYKIFSVYVSVADNDNSDGLEYFRNINYSEYDWNNVLNNYKNNSEYDTSVSVDSNDKILILQTCSMDPNYYEKYYRYNLLIMAKLI